MTDEKTTAGELLCPFCGAPWSKYARAKYEDAESYDTYGHGTPDICITIVCDNCNRMMYQKDSIDRA